MHRTLAAIALVFFSAILVVAGSNNPKPAINQPLVPVGAIPGGAAFTLTVNGTGFVSSSVVNWNGSARSTTFVSSSKLTAHLGAADIASASTASVTVASPAPGGGTSNAVYFPIAPATPVVALTSDAYALGQFGEDGNGLIATGDVNGDGKVDVVSNVYSPSGVFTFLGNGDGTLQAPINSPSSCHYGLILLGDFNNDGKLDVFAIDVGGDDACVMLGNGDGTFQPGTSVFFPGEGVGSLSPVIADFNGDGNLDVAFGEAYSQTGQFFVLLGNGDGTFQTVVDTNASSTAVGPMAAGDFNHDGKMDLVAQVDFGVLQFLAGNGDGTFQSGVPINTSQPFTPSSVADFNGDGNLDIAGSSGSFLSVMLGNGNGTFQPEVSYPAVYGTSCTFAADLNNDGKLDLGCAAGFAGSGLSIFFGNGDGTFQPQTNYFGVPGSSFSVALGDFNNDGLLDIASGSLGPSPVALFLQTTVQALPASLFFKTQPIGTKSVKQTVTITNVGSSALKISSIGITGTNAADFTQVNTCGSGLVAGGSCTITVQFDPSIPAPEFAAIAIADNAVGSPQLIQMQGSGTNELMTPHLVRFGNVTVGQSSAPATVTLKNESTTTRLPVGNITIQGSNAGDFSQTNNCHPSLAPGASCQIKVTFTPGAKGNRIGSVGSAYLPYHTNLQGFGN